MAAARSDMAEPEGLLPGEAAAAAAEEEEAGAGSSSSPSSSAAAAETESLLLLNGEAESMSEPSPESASQAGDGEDEDEEEEEEEEEEEGGEEEESSLVGSSSTSSGCCSDETRSLSPGGSSEADAKEEPKGPRGSQEDGLGRGGGGGGGSSSSSVSSGGDEGYGTGGGGGGSSSGSSSCSATSGGRRGSLEMSSDGEPLSRMDSEDSISSTIMDVDSTISSGRSTPVMMNGQGVPASSAKSIAYNCCWDHCHACFSSSPDLADHIRSIHVDGQRGGCVVGGCNASFASQGGLARHVPTHFSQQNSSKVASQPKAKEESPSKAGMNKRRKLKNKRRRSLPRPHDFFDAQTLDAIRHRAICFNLSAHIESLGKGHSVVFHSTVIAKRKEDSGKIKLLLHWTPEDILPDVWVNESERHQLKTKVVHLSKLPKDTALLLDPNIYRNSSKGGTYSGILKDHFC
ncbi:zinc finger protein AEBP2 isoform 3-T3 [Morphnus guianensis]